LLQVSLLKNQSPIVVAGYNITAHTVETPLIVRDFDRRPDFQAPAQIKAERTRPFAGAGLDGNEPLSL
jgi:hypothetical protein